MIRILFAGGLIVWLACGCRSRGPEVHPALNSVSSADLQIRNNAASLLADLLNDEKNVSKIFVVKNANSQTKDLIKLIAATAKVHALDLEEMATNDPGLNLHELALPPGEKAARASEAKSTEHQLLFSSGPEFEFRLLLTQAQAQNYGQHLAAVAAEHSPGGEAVKFRQMSESMNRLYAQTLVQMRLVPQNNP